MSPKSKIICEVLLMRLEIFQQLNDLDQLRLIEKPPKGDIVLPVIADIFPKPNLN